MRNPPVDALVEAEPRAGWEVAADYLALTKPRLSSLVLFTTAAGFLLTAERWAAVDLLAVLVATAGTIGAANAINSILERRVDLFMGRTATRPLPAGRLTVQGAIRFAFWLSAASLPALLVLSGPLTALLGLLALVSYVGLYTPLKRTTPWALVVGALPGAIPPLMGTVAATGRIEGRGLALFAILFVWQLPHFLAISLFRQVEYEAAGFASFPGSFGVRATWHAMLATAVLLVPVSFTPVLAGLGGPLFLALAFATSGGFLVLTVVGWWRSSARWARHVFFASLLYLPVLFVALSVGR